MVNNSKRKSEGRRIARKCVEEYNRLGYVPYDKCEESVNETLDSAYGDYCISVVAEKLGEKEIAESYRKSSMNYRNLFDPQYGCMRGKDSNGNFRDEEFDSFAWGRDYTEGSSWQASFAVPHDYIGLANLYGGKDKFLEKIDELFSLEPKYSIGGYPLEIHEMTEMASVNFGQCAISNQPSFHIPFLYAEFGQKEKSHEIVERIQQEVFSFDENGFPGDEDNGSAACWYLFAVLGFYPMCPGKTEFTVSGALCKKAMLCRDGKQVDIIKKLKNQAKISYFDLMQG
jgi:predicted alpha-1,2-mannosidase